MSATEPLDDSRKKPISREPWWAVPPEPGQDEMTLEWGYLEFYADGSFQFVNERPTDDEIHHRRGCRLPV